MNYKKDKMEETKKTKHSLLTDVITFVIIGSIIYIDTNNLFVSNGSKIDFVGNVIYWVAGFFLGGGLLLALFGTYNFSMVLQLKEERSLLLCYGMDFSVIVATFFLKNQLLYTSIKSIGYLLTFFTILIIAYIVDKKFRELEDFKHVSLSHLLGGLFSTIFIIFVLYILRAC